METTSTEKISALVVKLDTNISKVLTSEKMKGFEKAFLIAEATAQLKLALTPEYMKPIMQLQGSKLGFKTDKDDSGGYPLDVVRDCLIEAVLTGVQPFGNQFNIIAGNCYITKEGFKELLGKLNGVDYEIIPGLPRINSTNTGAAILMKVEWTMSGETKTKEIDVSVRINAKMGVDAIIGKATRKARAWLFNRITGLEIGDGEAETIDGGNANVVDSKMPDPKQKESERMLELIKGAKTYADLQRIPADKISAEHLDLYTQRTDELKPKQ